MTELEKSNPTRSNQSTEKLLILLETLSVLDEPIRLHDLAKRLGMNASTVLRFLTPLQKRGYVTQDPASSRYRLSYKLCSLAQNIGSRTDIRNTALPFLRSIAHLFKETVNLSVERDMSILYLEVINYPGKSLMMMQRIGHVAPMHCTGVGKLFLSQYSRQELAQYIALKGLTRFTDKTVTDPEELGGILEDVRKSGYSFDNEECEEGARCIAAPIRDFSGRIVAGISVSGPLGRMTDEYIFSNLPFLIESAKQVSLQLGWEPAAASSESA